MRSRCLFLLIYLLGNSFGGSSAQRNTSCTTNEACGQMAEPTHSFLQCVGLPSTDTGTDHLRRLKEILEATMDIYTFMRSSLNGVPLMSLQGELLLNPTVDPLRNEALVQMWMEVKMKPLLKSVTKNFLSCLSTKNFSCSTYQTMVKELSHHYSEMSPVRQKWIYTFFMYPFLSGDRVSGCMNSSESSEEWLLKNFGAFRVLARMTDFSTLNMVFSRLEVLHLLSAAQKAELLITPGVQLLDNTTIEVLFHSIVTGSPGHPPTSPTWSNNWTSPGHPTSFPTFSPHPTYDAYRPSLQNSVVNGFMTALKPISSFVHDFISLTKVRGVSEMKSTTLTQFLLNWTLAELADSYRPRNTALVPEMPEFDVTNMEDWYQHVVMPVLKRFLPHKDPMHPNITFAFQQLFFLDQDNETTVILDVCSLTLDGNPCGLTDVVENVAHVLRCAAQTDLKLTEQTLMRLVIELTKRLNVLIRELSKMDLKEVADELQQIFTQAEPPSLTTEHLEDPDFILKWFEVKLMPLLPAVPPQLLSCLSTKNFSCPVYQTIVRALSTHMGKAKDNPVYSQIIFENFIFPFLLHHNTSDPQCVVGNNSRQWLEDNFAYFSKFAFITDFYKLYPQFSGVEVIPVLSPKQLAELILLPLPTPPKKEEVIDAVFQYLVGTMGPNYFTEVLEIMVQLAKEVHPTCNVFKHIFTRLYHAAPKVPPDTEPLIWTTIDDLMSIAPEDCLPDNLTCPVIQINGSNICQKDKQRGPRVPCKHIFAKLLQLHFGKVCMCTVGEIHSQSASICPDV
ncbi:uncharacterized protein mslnb [Gouania willdenowi]|uniref:uncharacterized protein mslnb n=1 Tax=Gouania willdenowi TaxID=441366 RepID=UPI0010547B6F|nr:uncharacterized protein LOC114454171 [Gouania willdenowi]